MHNLQEKSHEALMKLLNNIGIVGACLMCLADIIFVIIFVFGVQFEKSGKAVIIFSIINAFIGVGINVMLRLQGQKYAELENKELCEKFYKKRVKEKKYISMGTWSVLTTLKDIITKGCTTVFGIYGIIYISIEGSHNPIQILITIVTLVLFICFGLINMNSAYTRFYNIQKPYIEKYLEEKENNGTL